MIRSVEDLLSDEERLPSLAAKRGELLHDTEQRLLGFDHCEVGSQLLHNWELPAALCDAARWHHHPHKAPSEQCDIHTVHVADVFVEAMEFGCSGSEFVSPLATDSWQRLGLEVDAIPGILEDVEHQLEITCDIMLRNVSR